MECDGIGQNFRKNYWREVRLILSMEDEGKYRVFGAAYEKHLLWMVLYGKYVEHTNAAFWFVWPDKDDGTMSLRTTSLVVM